ncbi:TNF receptor-associated factor 3 [Lamellibrachia satsuma]|nr:TNF receptor-associated factor 3 [Lamellibrachia satsuma]
MTRLFEIAPEVRCPANEEDCDIISRDRMFYDRGMCREILSQQVYCSYKEAGCSNVMKWSELQRHVERCEFVTVDCSFKRFGCPERMPKKLLNDHIKRCGYVPVVCTYCQTEIGRVLQKAHIKKDCPNVFVDCPYKCGEKAFRNQMNAHKQSCIMRPQQCQYYYIGCTFEGSESEVRRHEQTANQQHFDILVKHAEEVDLKRIQSNTQLEEEINENKFLKRKLTEAKQKINRQNDKLISLQEEANENKLLKRKLNEANQKINQQNDNLTRLQVEIEQVKAQQETYATRNELNEQRSHVEETLSVNESQIVDVEQRITNLEQDNSTRVGSLSAETLRELEVTTQQVGVHDIRLAEMDVRFQCLETANYEGVLIWKVTDYIRRKQDAFQNRIMYSQPFYTDHYGYKMCGRVCLNGDGTGKGTHLSLFFVLMRGEYDALLEWPFRQKVTLSLLDQSPARHDLSYTFHPDPTSLNFRRLTTEKNIASGFPMFISHGDLKNSRFLKDDTIYMKIVVGTTLTFFFDPPLCYPVSGRHVG